MQLKPFKPLDQWGHRTQLIDTSELLFLLKKEVALAISNYEILPDGPIPSTCREGFSRVEVEIPLSEQIFEHLMNGATGYRARYAAGVEYGEAFNLLLIQTVAPLIIVAENFYSANFDQKYCERSLMGSFSKFWYPRSLTDPSEEEKLLIFHEELLVPQWKSYWSKLPPPRKGLLAPMPEHPSVLLLGTFINNDGEEYEQKPDRSEKLHQEGWT